MTIDCVVLSPVDDECQSVFDQWQNKAEYCDFIDTNYLSIQLSMGHVFFYKIDLSVYKAAHENNTLQNIDEYSVYCISSRTVETIRLFIRQTCFSDACMFENDKGMIGPLQEICEDNSFFVE